MSSCRKSAKLAALLVCGVGLLCCDARRLRALPDEVVATHDNTHNNENIIRMVVALVASVLMSAVSTAAGVGGGAFFVPLFCTLLQMSIRSAAALSQVIIAGGSLAGVGVSLFRRHPTLPDRPLIAFELALMFLPTVLLGVSAGLIGNTIFPEWLLTFLLLPLLLFLAYNMVKKALRLHKCEALEAVRQQKETMLKRSSSNPTTVICTEAAVAALEKTLAPQPSLPQIVQADGNRFLRRKDSARRASQVSIYDDDLSNCQYDSSFKGLWHARYQAAMLIGCWTCFAAFQVVKSRWHHCGSFFWALQASETALCLAAACALLTMAYRTPGKEPNGAAAPPGSEAERQPEQAATWTLRRLLCVSLATFFSGVTAGLLGISGGMIISPLLLQLGVHPQVAAATSTFVVLLSTAVAALTFGLAGMLRAQPAAIFSVCCFCASLIGVLCIASLIRRTNKVSILLFLLAGTIVVAGGLTAAFAGRHALMQLVHHEHVSFSNLCIPRI